ncbi:MAG: cyanoexosortase A [Acaryochloris sp. RU_4_1]|nr:cyanoexosortase A [Acaryochloris sp. RU_4_1]NJR56156.1 cyanoexosortase A [Acaryochloris sp. CRU_2_0]
MTKVVSNLRRLNIPAFWLLAIGVGLTVIHLSLLWQTKNPNILGMNLLYWLAICSLLWEKRRSLTLNSSLFSSFTGTVLITLVLLKSTSPFEQHVPPLMSAVGLGMLASGLRGLKQYWRELLLFLVLELSRQPFAQFIEISELTAKFAAYILWYLNFKVSSQGVNITLSRGSVEVFHGCSGMESIIFVLGLALLFLMLFPTRIRNIILIPIVAIFLGFIMNGFRVALLAVLVDLSSKETFKYWHQGDGSLIFSVVTTLIFGVFCWLLLQLDSPLNQDSVDP